jgi:hypothetical protein
MTLAEIHNEINQLVWKVDKLCHSPRAKSHAQANKWMKNPKLHILEKIKLIDPLPIELEAEVERVSNLWLEYQNARIKSLAKFKASIDEIDRSIKSKENWVMVLQKSHLFSQVDVLNIGHVELFAYQLPCASPKKAKKYKDIGVAMAGLFFIEKLGEFEFGNDEASSSNPYDRIMNLDVIKALYDIACES